MQPVYVGGEVSVSKIAYRAQIANKVANLVNGNSVVVWTDRNASRDDSAGLLRLGFVGPDGNVIGETQKIVSTTAKDPSVCALVGGGFVVAWTDLTGPADVIKIQIFDSFGNSTSAAKIFDGGRDGYGSRFLRRRVEGMPNIAATDDGGFAVTYNVRSYDPIYNEIEVRKFDRKSTVGFEYSIKTSIGRQEIDAPSRNSSVVGLEDGKFVVIYDSSGTTYDSDQVDLFAQVIRADGYPADRPIKIIDAGSLTDHHPSVAKLGSGFVVAWESMGDIYGRIFDKDGQPMTGQFIVNEVQSGDQSRPDVTVTNDGDIVFTWQDNSGINQPQSALPSTGNEKFDGYTIKARSFWQNTPSSSEFAVTKSLFGEQVTVSADSQRDGSILFTWSDHLLGIGSQVVHLYNYVKTNINSPDYTRYTTSGSSPAYVSAGPGNDKVAFGPAANYFDGGPGVDTYSPGSEFSFSGYDWNINDLGTKVVVSGYGHRDELHNVENLQFSDGIISRDDGNKLFDTINYYSQNKDVWNAQVGALDHYQSSGWREGRDPNAFFSTRGYLAANPDVRAAQLNPLDHYKTHGWMEGRDPSAGFDNELYLTRNPDVKAAGLNPLEHYLQYGQAEGRQIYAAVGKPADLAAHPGFDAEYYLLSNPDVAAVALLQGDSFAFAYDHYQRYGWKERRNPNAVFDVKGYLDIYTDVRRAGIDPLMHYDTYGWKEGRDPSKSFDTTAYLSAYTDVDRARIDPMQHYLQYGALEGRNTFIDGTFGAGTKD